MIAGEGTNLPGLPDAPRENDRGSRRLTEASAYAQILVSEIRLYHELEVIKGRRARDLAARLEAWVAPARERYTQRFPEVEDGRHFQDAVVRILAGGDPGRLGRQG